MTHNVLCGYEPVVNFANRERERENEEREQYGERECATSMVYGVG